MRGTTRVELWKDRQLLRQPELRAVLRRHGVCRVCLPGWNHFVAERYVQWKRHLHRQRNTKLSTVRVCLFNRAMSNHLPFKFPLRSRLHVQCLDRGVPVGRILPAKIAAMVEAVEALR